MYVERIFIAPYILFMPTWRGISCDGCYWNFLVETVVDREVYACRSVRAWRHFPDYLLIYPHRGLIPPPLRHRRFGWPR